MCEHDEIDDLNYSDIQKDLDFDEEQRRLQEKAHSKLIKGYVDYQVKALAKKEWYKLAFIVVCGALLCAPLIILWYICDGIQSQEISEQSYATFVGMLGSVISFVSSVIVLPKIVAEYCFNKDEDLHVLQLFVDNVMKDKE